MSVSDLKHRQIAQLFELSQHGLLWLDAQLRVLACNGIAAKILEKNDGVRLRNERIVFSRGNVARELDRLVAPMRLGGDRSKVGGRLLRRLDRPSGRGTLVIAATVLNIGSIDEGIIMVMHDLSAKWSLNDEMCKSIYGLTPAETRVAARLIDGRSAPGIALDLGLSPLTVRTHIKRVFKKVDVQSQTQLMSALCRIAYLPSVLSESRIATGSQKSSGRRKKLNGSGDISIREDWRAVVQLEV